MCSLVCKIKKSKKNSPEREKIEKKIKKGCLTEYDSY